MEWQRAAIAIDTFANTALERQAPRIRGKLKKRFLRFQRDSFSNIDFST